MKNIFRNARSQHTRAPVLRKQLESVLFQKKKKKKGGDKPRRGKTGCRKQKDQDKVLREMEKGDGRGELWAGHRGLCPEGKRPDIPRDGSTGNPTSKHLVRTLSSGLKW